MCASVLPTASLSLSLQLYVHDQQLTVGRLTVEVMRGSQLAHPPSATATFCTISTCEAFPA